MNLKTLRELVKHGEGLHLEFKLKTNHPDKIVKELVAFANSEGGRLLVGISDDRFIQGLKYPDEDEFTLVKAIETYCTPALSYSIDKVPISVDREVLSVHIPPSLQKPHYVFEKTSGIRRAFIRIGDKSVQASREMCEIMRRSSVVAGTKFTFGEKERKLMQFLETGEKVTVESFAQYAGISKIKASNTLIILALAKVIVVHPNQIADQFTRAID